MSTTRFTQKRLDEETENKIKEILKEENLTVLGIGDSNDGIIIGAKISNYEEIIKKLSQKIKDETGIDATINL